MEKLSYYTSHSLLNSATKTKQLPLAVNTVFHSYTASVKNIENSANFIIRNLISSYIKSPIIPVVKDIDKINSIENNNEVKVE